jgi:hypothetical protein
MSPGVIEGIRSSVFGGIIYDCLSKLETPSIKAISSDDSFSKVCKLIIVIIIIIFRSKFLLLILF